MPHINISIDSSSLDEATEKANRLCELLREVAQIVDSLFRSDESEP